MAGNQEEKEWYVGLVLGTAVSFRGTHDEAREHLNLYADHVSELFKSAGLVCVRKQNVLVVKPTGVNNGSISQQLDNHLLENGNDELGEGQGQTPSL